MSLCSCPVDQLCDACFGRELMSKRGQADVLGQQWAELVARDPAHRGRAAWPSVDDARTLARVAVQVRVPHERYAAWERAAGDTPVSTWLAELADQAVKRGR